MKEIKYKRGFFAVLEGLVKSYGFLGIPQIGYHRLAFTNMSKMAVTVPNPVLSTSLKQ